MRCEYDKDGISKKVVVDVLGWDRDKYFLAKGADGELFSDKSWKFSLKRSNKMYKLPEFELDYEKDVYLLSPTPSNKCVAKELKDQYKHKIGFTVVCGNELNKEFKFLRKALLFAKSVGNSCFVMGSEKWKNSSLFYTLVEQENGVWNYYDQCMTSCSEKTLKNWCWKS